MGRFHCSLTFEKLKYYFALNKKICTQHLTLDLDMTCVPKNGSTPQNLNYILSKSRHLQHE